MDTCAEAQKPKRIRVGGKAMAQKVVRKVPPQYPPEARASHLEGVVELQVVIGTDGTVQQARVLSGPEALVDASLDAVKQWRYEPTLVKNEPVEVVTMIDLIFSLH